MRLIAYIRVSTEGQLDGHSPEVQERRLAAYCVAHDHTLVTTINDGDETGGMPLEKRPGGKQMLQMLRNGEADGFVVVRLERAFRDLLDGLIFFRTTAGKYGLVVHSLAEHIDTSTASGRLALNVHLLLADHERDKGAERTREVMGSLRQQGRVYGTVPYGCIEVGRHIDGDGKVVRGRLFREPQAWAVREWIVSARAEGTTYDAIRHDLHMVKREAAPTGGKRWGKSTLRGIVESHATLMHLPIQGEGTCQ